MAHDYETAQNSIIDFLSHSQGVSADMFTDTLYIHHGAEAVYHLLRVVSGLDSMVLGEPQILGQVTQAYEMALAQHASGTVLSALFRAAIHTGKRVRTETSIGVNPSSVSSVAANIAAQLPGDLSQRQVLLMGAGEMGVIAVKALQKRGLTKIIVVNRTFEKAQQLAQAWAGHALTFQQLPDALAKADIVISSTSAPQPILNQKLLAPAMATRPKRPLLLIDIAVPRDVDADVSSIANVHLHNIDDLQNQVTDNVKQRMAEIPHVEQIIAEEETQFMEWLSSLSVVSTITTFRQQLEQLRQQELKRLLNRSSLGKREQELVQTMSHRLINKILHEPTIRLKKEAAHGNGAAYTAAMHYLFALNEA